VLVTLGEADKAVDCVWMTLAVWLSEGDGDLEAVHDELTHRVAVTERVCEGEADSDGQEVPLQIAGPRMHELSLM
jgi:hypothetical protein